MSLLTTRVRKQCVTNVPNYCSSRLCTAVTLDPATHLIEYWLFCLNVTRSWKTYLLGTSKFLQKLLKIYRMVLKLISFLHIWVKQLLNLLAMKFHTKSFSFLGDMGDYIRLTDVPKRQVFPGHKFYWWSAKKGFQRTF